MTTILTVTVTAWDLYWATWSAAPFRAVTVETLDKVTNTLTVSRA